MPFSPFWLVRILIRRAALEDLQIALPAARLALRLLIVSARDNAARHAALEAAQALDYARALIHETHVRPATETRAESPGSASAP